MIWFEKGVFMKKRIGIAIALFGLSISAWVLAQGMMQQGTTRSMMQQGMGQGMMGGMGMMATYPPDAVPLATKDAQLLFEQYAKQFGSDIRVKDVMVFSSNFYAQLIDADGNGLAEVLVDRYRGTVMPEPGPNMMWNGRASMMGFGFTGTVQFDEATAKERANTFLITYLSGATVKEGQAFSGYYTFDYGRDGIEGMLSVNAYTGEIWPHTWHGVFLENAMAE
jgi:hypothetical protein